MNSLLKAIAALSATIILTVCLTSCENGSQAGASLIEDEVSIIVDSSFTITGRPIASPSVQSRTVLQLLGKIDAQGYGTLQSDIVTQYLASAVLDTAGVTADRIDSVKLVLRMKQNGFTGDSVVPMQITAYPLSTQLPSPIFSDFNPAGTYQPTPLGTASFTALFDGDENVTNDLEGNIVKDIFIDMPRKIGQDIFNQFKTSPSTFDTPQSFSKWFPGLYITTTFGSGRVTRIVSNTMYVYYHAVLPIPDTTRDTTINRTAAYLGVTPEVITNNNITYSVAPALAQMAAQNQPVMVAPTGYDIEFTFPAQEILSRYRHSPSALTVINSLSMSLPATEIANDYNIGIPPYILLIKKSAKDEFFAKSKLTDNVTSFYAAYNSATKSYNFSSMRDYIVSLLDKDQITPDDTDFIIMPVLVSFITNTSSNSYYYYGYYNNTSQEVNTISPYVTEPVMAKFDFSKAKIKFTFSSQMLKK